MNGKIIVPTLMPDELASGFLGRIGILNGYRNSKETLAAFDTTLSPSKRNVTKLTHIEMLALSAGVNLDQFVRQHTLIPVLRAIARANYHSPKSDYSDRGVLSVSGMRTSLRHAYLCPCCVREDNDYWGYSYWRRSHHLKGVTWCAKHLHALHVANTPSPFSHLPGDLLRNSRPLENFEIAISNDALNRYADIMFALLERHKPLPIRSATQLYRQRCKILGLRTTRTGTRKLLSDLAVELVPNTWLREVFPKVAEKEPRLYESSLDRVLYSPAPFATPAYGLAAALLWDSSDDALTSLADETDNDEPPMIVRKHYGKDYWSSDYAFSLYVRFGGAHSKIAKHIGANKKHVSAQFRRNGLPSLGRFRPDKIAAILRDSRSMDIKAICDMRQVKEHDILPFVQPNNSRFISALTLINALNERHPKRPVETATA